MYSTRGIGFCYASYVLHIVPTGTCSKPAVSFQAIYSQDWPLTPRDTEVWIGDAICLTVQGCGSETPA